MSTSEQHGAQPKLKMRQPSKRRRWCSFCGREEHEVNVLVVGQNVGICNTCVDQAAGVVRKKLGARSDGERRDAQQGRRL